MRTFLIVTLATTFLFQLALPARAAAFEATVISITDGDSMIVAHDGTPERIRLADVDAPEKKQAFGQAAKRYLSNLVFMQAVQIEPVGKDRYGRTLAYVKRSDGTDVGETLLRSGYAWVYRGKSKNSSFKQMEKEARSQRTGLWQDESPTAPWTFRHAQHGTRSTAARTPDTRSSDTSSLIHELLRERVPKPKERNAARHR